VLGPHSGREVELTRPHRGTIDRDAIGHGADATERPAATIRGCRLTG
jgi:hypothetical protein